MSLLTCNSLSVGHSKNKPILNNLNLNVGAEQLICLVGQNGSGKTTLLKSLCGIIPILSGDVLYNGENLSSLSAKELASKQSIVLSDKLSSNLTVFDILKLGRYAHTDIFGRLSSKDCQKIDEVIQILNITNYKNSLFSKLSDGQKQKVMLGRALVQNSEILFLDEPTNFLDLPNRLDLISKLKLISKLNKRTIIFSSHDWQIALELANVIWVIKDNGTIQVTTPEDFIVTKEIDSYFYHPDYTFDSNQGKFISNVKTLRQVKIIGPKDKAYWVDHALLKYNFPEIRGLTIYIHDDYYEADYQNNKIKYKSIYKLLTSLRDILL